MLDYSVSLSVIQSLCLFDVNYDLGPAGRAPDHHLIMHQLVISSNSSTQHTKIENWLRIWTHGL